LLRLKFAVYFPLIFQPFWPTGSGAARGFLSVFDSAWMIKAYGAAKVCISEILAARETSYRLLAQTSPENLNKNILDYTIDPRSRYSQIENVLTPEQVNQFVFLIIKKITLQNSTDVVAKC